MNIPSSQIKFRPTLSQPAGKAESSNAPAEQQQSQEPTEKYESWVPLANAAVVGGAIALPTAVGALGHQFLGAGLATGLAVSVVPVATAVGVGAWAYNSAKEEFNGHPILTGLTTAVAAGAAGLGAMILSPIGANFGWTGVAVATAVGAVAAGGITAVGIHHANKKG